MALLAVVSPLFEHSCIFDSYALRIGKGTHKALERSDCFKAKVLSKRFSNSGFILKVDIKGFCLSVNQTTLLKPIEKRIKAFCEYARYRDSYKLGKIT